MTQGGNYFFLRTRIARNSRRSTTIFVDSGTFPRGNLGARGAEIRVAGCPGLGNHVLFGLAPIFLAGQRLDPSSNALRILLDLVARIAAEIRRF